MEVVVMKQLSFIFFVSWLSAMNGKAVGQDESEPPSQTYEVCGNDGLARGSSDTHPNDIQDEICDRRPIVHCPCQEGFTRLASGKCYLFSFQEKSWPDALASCQGVGTTLAYPMNVVEDVALATYLKNNFNGLTGWWLGGTVPDKSQVWIWAHNNASIAYSDWDPNQPDGGPNTAERCLQYYNANWRWNNWPCKSLKPFVCQQ